MNIGFKYLISNKSSIGTFSCKSLTASHTNVHITTLNHITNSVSLSISPSTRIIVVCACGLDHLARKTYAQLYLTHLTCCSCTFSLCT